jgi:Ca2+:H+ antiporter
MPKAEPRFGGLTPPRHKPKIRRTMRYLNIAGYAAIPFAYLVHYLIGRGATWEPAVTFALAGLGVIPLAHLMGRATEHLTERTGPTWGGLLNATFGNAAELIIAIIAMTKGLNEIVQASLTGSILGNLLLVAGAAMVAGGWRRESQSFNRNAAENNAGMLAVAVCAMLFPAVFHHVASAMHDVDLAQHEWRMSLLTSIVLLAVYGLGLLFTLRTHAHIFSCPPRHPDDPEYHGEHGDASAAWSVKRSILMLLLASVGIGFVAELLVGAAASVAETAGWNEVFVGVILLAIIGNAAEHSTALMLALRNDMDTAMTITYQSSLQIALFAVPFLVLVSGVMVAAGVPEARHLTLMFSPMEVIAVFISVFIVVILGLDGRTNWYEGVMLLAVYAILGIAFFYIPAGKAAGYDSARGDPAVQAVPLAK